MSVLTDVDRKDANILALASSEVQTEDGKVIKLGYLWKNQPIIFVFLRHFACIACRAHATEVWKDRQKFEASGAKIVFIGNGQSSMIQYFKEDLGIQGAIVYTDPSLKSFEHAGFKRGFLRAHSPSSVVNFVKLMGQGHRQTIPTKANGNISQLGGVLALGTDGKVKYHKISESLGDFPTEEDMTNIPWISAEDKKKRTESKE